MQCMYCGLVSNPHISSRRGQVTLVIPHLRHDGNPTGHCHRLGFASSDGWMTHFFQKTSEKCNLNMADMGPRSLEGWSEKSRQSLVLARVWKSSDGKRLLYTGNDGRWYFGGWGLMGKQLTWWVQTMSLWVQFVLSKMWVSISGGVHVPNQWGCLPWGCVFYTFLYHLWAILMVSTLNLSAFMCNFWDKLMDKKH